MTDEQFEKSTLGRMKKGSSVHKKAENITNNVGKALVDQVHERMAQSG
jgi:hypothetical protein